MDLLRNIFKGDKVVWIIFLCLCVISVIEVFSASSTLAYKSGNHLAPISRHAGFLLAGAAAVWAFHWIPYQSYRILPKILLPVAGIFLVLLLVFDDLHIGSILVIEKTNEAGRWVKFFGVPFQPSEFAKMGVIIATAWRLSRGQNEQGADPKAFKYIMWVAGVTCVLILPENYSTAVLLFGVVFLMMFVGRVQARKLLTLGGGLVAAATLFVAFLFVTPNDTLEKIPLGHRFTTVKSRIANFTSNDKVPPAKYDMSGNGRQVGNARIAVATSGFLGKGPGNSVQRDFLSQAYSDFIFATFPAFLVLGVGLLLIVQAMFNMMVAVGLAPVTGQPLPLISRGGTSTLINCVYIGIILSVSRYTIELKERREAAAAVGQLYPAAPAETSQAEPSRPQNNDDEMA